MEPLSNRDIRRFVLGKQGLWPGRRWHGKGGLDDGLQAIDAVQVDPVSIVAPSNDIALWGRVDGYQPEDLRSLLYQGRRFFDHGGGLFIHPMTELPYWRVLMSRRALEPRWADFAEANPTLIAHVKAELRDRGPLRNRDLSGKAVSNYRGSKETSVALYYLWLIGELLTHSRDGKERVYDFLENVAPSHLQHVASDEDAEEFFTAKSMRQWGVTTARRYRNIRKRVTGEALTAAQAEAEIAARIELGQIAAVSIEESKAPRYVMADDLSLLQVLQAGNTPTEWQPIGSTTWDEVTFLSPLEYVSARGRAKELFSFDYIWEIYKPAAKRKYGPYTLPILYGDQLVARMDAKVDRAKRVMVVNGLWLEEWFTPDGQFRSAFERGLARFLTLVDADEVRLGNPLPF